MPDDQDTYTDAHALAFDRVLRELLTTINPSLLPESSGPGRLAEIHFAIHIGWPDGRPPPQEDLADADTTSYFADALYDGPMLDEAYADEDYQQKDRGSH